MTKYISTILIIVFLDLIITQEVSGQFTLPFGKVTLEDLSNKPYKPDPGADAIILSEKGVASLQYQQGFYIEFEKNVRIRIVNSKGYDYANIVIRYLVDNKMESYKGSTFNLKNGEKIETQIPKKSFIIEKSSPSYNTLKFNFPDVHEGSIVEFSFKMRLPYSDLSMLGPWQFQHKIPVIISSFTVSYPDAFVYKTLISGSSQDVHTDFSKSSSYFFGENVSVSINTWVQSDIPAFRNEPYILSQEENMTKLTFELARADFPNITYNDISPTYQKLNEKLLNRWDFGIAMDTKLHSISGSVTAGLIDDLSKLKKIHEYVSTNILWDGYYSVTASSTLKNVIRKEKGNSADINMILIAMLRSSGIKADPVILSTRSNGSLNQYSAMLQQFDYLVAAVTVGEKLYLVDATDPLCPFNLLPFECMNNTGRLISLTESRFVDLNTNERYKDSYKLNINLGENGNITGNLEHCYSGYSAYDVRKLIKLESEEGYSDIVKSASPDAEMYDFRFTGVQYPDSDVTMTCNLKIENAGQIAGDIIILNPVLSMLSSGNPFYSTERKYPVDFGCPRLQSYAIKLSIPEGYSVIEIPSDASIALGEDKGKFEFGCTVIGNEILINSNFNITKTQFLLSEYPFLRDIYNKMLQKEAEPVILKKNPVNNKR
jgi:hypothetical protein